VEENIQEEVQINTEDNELAESKKLFENLEYLSELNR